jgi:hypothetical protein
MSSVEQKRLVREFYREKLGGLGVLAGLVQHYVLVSTGRSKALRCNAFTMTVRQHELLLKKNCG